MGRIGLGEVVIILAIFILLFGAKKIPEIASSLGKAMRDFKKASEGVEEQVKKSVEDDSTSKKS